MPKVTFQYEDGTSTIVDVTAGENLLEVARKANVAIDAPCSGNGSCGKCRVRYISGELESEQTRHITDEDYAAGWRLSCCSKVTGDVTVLVPDIASAYKSRMKVADLAHRKKSPSLTVQSRMWQMQELLLKMNLRLWNFR